MAHPFFYNPNFSFNSFLTEVESRKKRHNKEYGVNTYDKFYKGDHWDSGNGYTGALPAIGDENTKFYVGEIQRKFTSRNVVKECVDRVVDTLLGKAPTWSLGETSKIKTPQELQKQRIELLQAKKAALAGAIINNPTDPNFPANDTPSPKTDQGQTLDQGQMDEKVRKTLEAEQILTFLWKNQKLSKLLRKLITKRLVLGKGFIRMYVPSRYYQNNNIVTTNDLLEAAKRIRVEYVPYDRASVIDYEGDKIGIVKLEKKNGSDVQQAVEFSFVDDNGNTFIGVIKKGGDSVVDNLENIQPGENETEYDAIQRKILKISSELSTPLQLEGALPVYEIEGAPFVTDQLIQNNKMLNLSMTMCSFVLVESGFRELALTNVALEMEEVPDPKDNTKTIRRPKAIKRGGGVTQNFVGLKTVDPTTGQADYKSPGVHYQDPVSVRTFADSKNIAYTNCLEEAKQLFVITTGDSTTTGESRIQSRQDHLKKCQEYKPELDDVGGWMMTSFLHFVALLSGRPGYFEGIEATFDSKVYAGELTTEEKRVVLEQIKAKTISLDSAMVLLGIDDPLVEKELIDLEEFESARKGVLLNPPQPVPVDVTQNPPIRKGPNSGQPNPEPGPGN